MQTIKKKLQCLSTCEWINNSDTIENLSKIKRMYKGYMQLYDRISE